MTTEDVAAFCTTPGGRRRDDMNFYTSGMKIVEIREKPSRNSARVCSQLYSQLYWLCGYTCFWVKLIKRCFH